MPSLTKRLKHLDRVRRSARTGALIEAFRHADADELDTLAAAILAHPSKEGFSALLARYYQIGPDIRAQILKGGSFFSAALSDALREESLDLRRLALQVIVETGDTQCLAAVGEQLTGASIPDDLVDLAARSLLAITTRLTDLVRSGRAPDRVFEHLDRVVARVADRYPEHRRPEPLLCAAMLSHTPGPELRAFFADTDHPSHFALRGVLKRFDDEVIADAALDWLGLEPLAPQILDRIAILAQGEYLPRMLRSVHLVQLPAVRRRLQRLNARYPASVPSETAIHEFSETEQRSLVQWLTVIPMSDPERVRRLGDGLNFESPTARLMALAALMKLQTSEADAMVESFCFDSDAEVARVALRHVLRRNQDELPRLLSRLCASPHQAVRRLAAIHLPIEDFDAIWHLWSIAAGDPTSDEECNLSEQAAAARSLLRSKLRLAVQKMKRTNRAVLGDGLRTRLLTSDRETRLRAIRLARDLRLIYPVELELLSIAAGDDARVASAVMSALGDIQSPASRDALLAALRHADARVRANAIESLHHRADIEAIELRRTLNERVMSNENRVRANAIRALASFDHDESDRHLRAMLVDSRPMHRISALWAAERINSVACATEIAQLARDDEIEPVRERAQHTAARLLARMHREQVSRRGVVSINADADADDIERETDRDEPDTMPRLSLVG